MFLESVRDWSATLAGYFFLHQPEQSHCNLEETMWYCIHHGVLKELIPMKRRLSVTNFSLENILPMFWLNAPVIIRAKVKRCELFIAMHYWGYTSLEVKGRCGLLLPPCLLITAIQQPETSSPPSWLKRSSEKTHSNFKAPVCYCTTCLL